jgi:2-amino-4-hydroxy-6-hydroxymethyldihydropteridine diphosphokinase
MAARHTPSGFTGACIISAVTERAFLSLGSNIEPEHNLPRAARELRSLGHILACSAVYQNPAVGPRHQPDFLNAAVLLETDLAPRALRAGLRRLEGRLGRRRTSDKYAPRTIDIDVVLFGSIVVQEPGMTLPDPDLLLLPHLALPVAELDADHHHPVSGERLGAIADRLRSRAALTPRPEVTRQMLIAAGLAAGGSQA